MIKLKISHNSLSNIGLNRNENQDYFYCGNPSVDEGTAKRISSLSVIADGLGGLSNGGEASKIAVNSFLDHIAHQNFEKNNDSDYVINQMLKGFKIANSKVLDNSKNNNIKSGTTLSASLLIDDNLYITHTGDTRVYIFEDKKLFKGYSVNQITVDDNPPGHPNSLTKYIGKSSVISPSTHTYKVKSGSLIILTSDGFHEEVAHERFINLVNKTRFNSLAKSLVDEANKVSGIDNITVLATKID